MSQSNGFWFKPRVAVTAKNCDETLQWNFNIPETDTVTTTQNDLHNTNPGVITVEVATMIGTRVAKTDPAIIIQFDAGMKRRDRSVLYDEFV